MVFDSSAKCQGISLNDVLMTGLTLINNLVGVLMIFRLEKIAVIADLRCYTVFLFIHPIETIYALYGVRTMIQPNHWLIIE